MPDGLNSKSGTSISWMESSGTENGSPWTETKRDNDHWSMAELNPTNPVRPHRFRHRYFQGSTTLVFTWQISIGRKAFFEIYLCSWTKKKSTPLYY